MSEHEGPAHAKFSASGASRWTRCYASVPMQAGIEDTPSRYAAEGTAAHELASWVLRRRFAPGAPPHEQIVSAEVYRGRVITVDGFDFEVGDEMIEAVDTYADAVGIFTNQPDTEHFVEQRVHYGRYLGVSDEEGFGTSDFAALEFDPAEGDCLHIDDFKYGQGVKVFAASNEQMMLYGLGCLHEFGHLGNFERVKMRIHQPRIDHIDECEMTVPMLLAFGEKMRAIHVQNVQKAERIWDTASRTAKDPKAELMDAGLFQPSEKACKFCRAKRTCPALAVAVLDVVTAQPSAVEDFEDLSADIVLPSAGSSPEWLSSAMQQVGLIETWVTGIRAEIERRILAGQEVPGYKLVTGKQGNRKWVDPAAVEARLKSARLTKEEMYDFKLISPTGAEKRLAKVKPKVWAELQRMYDRAPGKPSVAPVTDKRVEIESPRISKFDDLSDTDPDQSFRLDGGKHPFRPD